MCICMCMCICICMCIGVGIDRKIQISILLNAIFWKIQDFPYFSMPGWINYSTTNRALNFGLVKLGGVDQWKLADVLNVTKIIESSFSVFSTEDCHSGSFNLLFDPAGRPRFLAGSWPKKGWRRAGKTEKGGLKSIFVPFLFGVAGAP